MCRSIREKGPNIRVALQRDARCNPSYWGMNHASAVISPAAGVLQLSAVMEWLSSSWLRPLNKRLSQHSGGMVTFCVQVPASGPHAPSHTHSDLVHSLGGREWMPHSAVSVVTWRTARCFLDGSSEGLGAPLTPQGSHSHIQSIKRVKKYTGVLRWSSD